MPHEQAYVFICISGVRSCCADMLLCDHAISKCYGTGGFRCRKCGPVCRFDTVSVCLCVNLCVRACTCTLWSSKRKFIVQCATCRRLRHQLPQSCVFLHCQAADPSLVQHVVGGAVSQRWKLRNDDCVGARCVEGSEYVCVCDVCMCGRLQAVR